MTIDQLRYLDLLVRHGSVNRAAESCFMSQSALTRQISAMEREVGFSIFERTASGIHLTPAGEVFYRQTRKILPIFDNSIHAALNTLTGMNTIRVGIVHYIRSAVINTCEAVVRQDPSLRFAFIPCRLNEAYDALVNNRIDIMFLAQLPPPDERFTAVPVYSAYHSIVVPEKSEFYVRNQVAMKELEGRSVLFPQETKYAIRAYDSFDSFQQRIPRLNALRFSDPDEADALCMLYGFPIITFQCFESHQGFRNIPLIDSPVVPFGIICLAENRKRWESVIARCKDALESWFKAINAYTDLK